MQRALEDVLVIDATIARAGPTCIRQLSDWGADVIRVEAPEVGGPSESVTGRRHGSDSQNMHRNKRSICLNLKDPRGRELFYELTKTADIVVENMRPSVKARLGIDYETLRKVNRGIVYGSISGFGQDGPYAEFAGLDQVAQGMGGLMSVTGHPGGGPVRAGVAIADLTSGMFLAIGLLAALHERDRSGEGQWVRTSLLEAMICMLDFQATRWTVDHEIPPQEGNNHPVGTPVGCYATADGYINIAAPNNRLFSRLCDAMEIPEVATDPRFMNYDDRFKQRPTLLGLIADRLEQKTTSEWMALFNAAGVPAGPVNSIDQVFEDPQVRHLGMAQDVEHPELGTLSLIRNAATMTRTPSVMHSAAPELGEHTDSVLAGLGVSAKEIEELREAGVV